jgi:hypothetical protein
MYFAEYWDRRWRRNREATYSLALGMTCFSPSDLCLISEFRDEEQHQVVIKFSFEKC